ncbi:MAG: hypothetical protein KGZ63_04255 [Clostridiales bacterium]|jgi:hypothetical protein|nr:hypothetical protein [Clostridiales bacterium]
MGEMIFAYFEQLEDAQEAMRILRNNGYIAALDKIDRGSPDPELSVSALMVGFLPDLAHGLFGTGNREDEKDGAYILLPLEDDQNKEDAVDIIKQYDGIELI